MNVDLKSLLLKSVNLSLVKYINWIGTIFNLFFEKLIYSKLIDVKLVKSYIFKALSLIKLVDKSISLRLTNLVIFFGIILICEQDKFNDFKLVSSNISI